MAKKTALLVAAAVASSLTLLLAPAIGLGGWRGDSAPVKGVKVRVMDNFFEPRSTGVPQGGKVVWLWRGTSRHNVRFTRVPPNANRRGSRTKIHGRWSKSFEVPGLYRYVCTLYSGMRGTITVKAPKKNGEG